MKQILITLFLILSILISPVYAQIDVPTEDAVEIGITDAGGYYTGTEVEAALQEIGAGTAIDHGLLQGLADSADHAWALLINATRPLTADWDVGDYDITLKDFTMDGNFLLQSATDSTTAFQVKDNAGNVVLDVDTVGEMVGIGTDAPKSMLGIAGTVPVVWLFDTGNMAYWGFGAVGGGFSMFESNASGNIVEKFISLWLGGGNAYVAINEGKQDIDFRYSGDTTDDIIVFDAGTESLDFLDNVPIKMGTGKDAEIYYNNTNLIIDPDVVGTGKVLIGATGDDDLKANVIEATELFNSAGNLKIMPDVQGDVTLFQDTDVADDAPGKSLFIYRKAPEGDNFLQLLVNLNETAVIASNTNMSFQSNTGFVLFDAAAFVRLVSGDNILVDLGDAAGANHLYVRDSGSNVVVDIDSDGNMQMDGNLTVDGTAIVGGASPDSLFEVDGAEGLAIETVTGDTTLDATHSTVLANCSGNCTMTLPTAASSYNNTDGIGRIYEVKKIDADADTVTIDGNGSETIDGTTTAVITVQYENITVQSNGTAWYIL